MALKRGRGPRRHLSDLRREDGMPPLIAATLRGARQVQQRLRELEAARAASASGLAALLADPALCRVLPAGIRRGYEVLAGERAQADEGVRRALFENVLREFRWRLRRPVRFFPVTIRRYEGITFVSGEGESLEKLSTTRAVAARYWGNALDVRDDADAAEHLEGRLRETAFAWLEKALESIAAWQRQGRRTTLARWDLQDCRRVYLLASCCPHRLVVGPFPARDCALRALYLYDHGRKEMRWIPVDLRDRPGGDTARETGALTFATLAAGVAAMPDGERRRMVLAALSLDARRGRADLSGDEISHALRAHFNRVLAHPNHLASGPVALLAPALTSQIIECVVAAGEASARTGYAQIPERLPGPFILLSRGDECVPSSQRRQVCRKYRLRQDYGADALERAASLPADPEPRVDYAGRRDLREMPFVTIDGATTRDFDDAVCVRSLTRGRTRLLVAIADVTHYVPAGSAIDREAAARTSTVYFPGTAVHMLPDSLADGICSLQPERDRLVVVADMVFDRKGARQRVSLYEGIVRSRARLTYDGVARAVGAPVQAAAGSVPRGVDLDLMAQLMRRLRARRQAGGALMLGRTESAIAVSRRGYGYDLQPIEPNIAHHIIEEFMVAANRAVAELVGGATRLPLAYRVHPRPEPKDIENLNRVLARFSLRVPRRARPADFQRVAAKLATYPTAATLVIFLLRAMRKAFYATDNQGHFGLAVPAYVHFTSPIRRYADILVHRQVKHFLAGRKKVPPAEVEAVRRACRHCSQREIAISAAQREMARYKKIEYIREHLYESGQATVVSAGRSHFTVEMARVPLRGRVLVSGEQEAPIRDSLATELRLPRRGLVFRLGDTVQVAPVGVSLRRRDIEMALVDEEGKRVWLSPPRRIWRPALVERADGRSGKTAA